jgi:adenine-specific DNA-methyltransferase
MKKAIFKYLKSYSCETEETNRLIVSSFLKENGIDKCENLLIKSLIIRDEDKDFEQFSKFNQRYKIVSIEDLIRSFEFVISPEEKVVTGAVYTPERIRLSIVENTLNQISNNEPTICDLACGCGGFLFTATQFLRGRLNKSYSDIYEQHIFGIDLMGYSIRRSEILLSLLAILGGEDCPTFKFNLFVGNSLNFDFNFYIEGFLGFDAIVGNPPYVCSRNIDGESKSMLKNFEVSSTGHPDLYIPFFELGVNNLKLSGSLGFITMNSFFKSLNGRALRKYFSERHYKLVILDFGGIQIFDANLTYTCICYLKKEISNKVEYEKATSSENIGLGKTHQIRYDELDDFNGWNFQSHKTIKKIESVGTPFDKVFKTSSGIATLKNSIFIIKYSHSDDNYFFLEDEGKIEREVCTDILNPNRFIRSCDATNIKKKIIFPYEYVDDIPQIIYEDKFKALYPFAYKYLENRKEELSFRDKGNGKYEAWYAYGRKQGLEKYNFKLLFPHITPIIPHYVLSEDSELLFHNGLALISDDKDTLLTAKKIMQSKLFWFYIVNTSKPYGSGYFSLSRNYIKSFGIYNFSETQKRYLIEECDQRKIDEFLETLYEVSF